MKFICGGLLFCLLVGITLLIRGVQEASLVMGPLGGVLTLAGSIGLHYSYLNDQELCAEIEESTKIFKP